MEAGRVEAAEWKQFILNQRVTIWPKGRSSFGKKPRLSKRSSDRKSRDPSQGTGIICALPHIRHSSFVPPRGIKISRHLTHPARHRAVVVGKPLQDRLNCVSQVGGLPMANCAASAVFFDLIDPFDSWIPRSRCLSCHLLHRARAPRSSACLFPHR